MGNLLQLPRDGGVDFRVLMAVEIGPDAGVRVEIFAAVCIAEHGALAGRDEDRLALEPVAHLREGMPDVGVVEFRERVHGRRKT